MIRLCIMASSRHGNVLCTESLEKPAFLEKREEQDAKA